MIFIHLYIKEVSFYKILITWHIFLIFYEYITLFYFLLLHKLVYHRKFPFLEINSISVNGSHILWIYSTYIKIWSHDIIMFSCYLFSSVRENLIGRLFHKIYMITWSFKIYLNEIFIHLLFLSNLFSWIFIHLILNINLICGVFIFIKHSKVI